MTDHPLQIALDRSARALYTATDLIEIAKTRKGPNARSDGRQASLYRAAVTASVGFVEEATEALASEALRALGIAPRGMAILEATISRIMQNPNSEEIRKLMNSFIGYDPVQDLRVRLRTSQPAFRNPNSVGLQTSHELFTIYNQERLWSGRDAVDVLNRLVKIRHSFAHQDSSVVLFTKKEIERLRSLSTRQATDLDEISFVEKLNATCAVRVLSPTQPNQDPIRDWRLHETHQLNALLATAGIVSSLADGLAEFLEINAGITRASYDGLHLDIEKGAWVALAGPTLASSPCGVSWRLTKYTPGSRI